MAALKVRKYNTITKCRLCKINMLNVEPRTYYCVTCQKRVNKKD